MKLPSAKTALIVIVTVICTITLTTLLAMILSHSRYLRLPSLGTIYCVGYEVYGGDIDNTTGYPQLNWSSIYIGSSTNRSFSLRSKSNIPTTPALNVTNWIFKDSKNTTAPDPPVNNITVNWNLGNTTMDADQVISVTITLETQSDSRFIQYIINYNITQFSFDITIYPSIDRLWN